MHFLKAHRPFWILKLRFCQLYLENAMTRSWTLVAINVYQQERVQRIYLLSTTNFSFTSGTLFRTIFSTPMRFLAKTDQLQYQLQNLLWNRFTHTHLHITEINKNAFYQQYHFFPPPYFANRAFLSASYSSSSAVSSHSLPKPIFPASLQHLYCVQNNTLPRRFQFQIFLLFLVFLQPW